MNVLVPWLVSLGFAGWCVLAVIFGVLIGIAVGCLRVLWALR